MLRLRLLRIWAACTKKYRKTPDMYEADACILQASAFFRCRKITDANVLNGFFKRLETYPEMKTERFTAVKRSVFV